MSIVIKYRVFFFIHTQEWASCEPILGLLRPQKASMGSQDWAQITFREEINSNGYNNESARWSAKKNKSKIW